MASREGCRFPLALEKLLDREGDGGRAIAALDAGRVDEGALHDR